MKRLAPLDVLPCVLLVLSQLSAENLNLTAEYCTNSSTFQNIQGTFQAYSVYIDVDAAMDEFKPLVVTCGLNALVPEECKDSVWATLPDTDIIVNGTIPYDHSFTKHYRPHIKQFATALYFEEHERAVISCITPLEGGGLLVSDTTTLDSIDELHAYKIIPGNVDVSVGNSFALTCITDNNRGLGVLTWTLWNEPDGYETLVTCSSTDPHQQSLCTIEDKVNGVPPHSVLTVSTENFKHSNETVEYTYRCNAAVNHTSQHMMLGEAHVTVHPAKVGSNTPPL
jgi:hypothetical protein